MQTSISVPDTHRNKTQKESYNYQMCVLSAIGICFVLLGHIGRNTIGMGTFYSLFPYYSFHLPLFVFISGYFYKEAREAKPVLFMLKKVKSFLLPYYLINGCFYLFQSGLRFFGYSIGEPFQLSRWLLDPWISLQPQTFSIPTWYLFAIFLSECVWMLCRKAASFLIGGEALRETILLVLQLAAGVLGILYVNSSAPTETAIVYLRSLVMIPFLQTGLVYRKFLEKKDTLSNLPYFLIVFLIQYIFVFCFQDYLSPGLWGLVQFDHYGVGFYLLALNGIALYLRVSRIISEIPARSKLILSVGKNTRQIMSYHLFGYFCLNTILLLLHKMGLFDLLIGSFQEELYFSRIYYTCTEDARMILVYMAAGIAVSLFLSMTGKRLAESPFFRKNNVKE